MPALYYTPHPVHKSVLIPMGCEVFRDIPDWEGFYAASNWGRVKSVDRIVNRGSRGRLPITGRIRKPTPNNKGYLRVTMSRKSGREDHSVHRLVLETFIGPCPDGMECRHLDGDRTNNHIFNLAWGTSMPTRLTWSGTAPPSSRQRW